ncbi:MAG: hypothetical protein AAB449_02830 [Patescibacteria group bacterium]
MWKPLFAIAILAGLGLAGYLLFFTAGLATTPSPTPSALGSVEPLKPARQAPAGYREYRSEPYRFAVFYPDALSVREYDEGGGATTITFQNISEGQGFQIYVLPYGASQVGPDRLAKDAPGGVKEPKDFTLDGAPANAFFSTSAALGDTREVWFINDGFLYEVTTHKSLDSWLDQILQTWQFI